MTSYKPLVSVIIPVYNCEEYLAESLSSLLSQSYKNLEIIAVNDGSTDSSSDILKDFSKKDPRIKIISQKNSGIVKALNRGISEATGDFIARMDGDDISFPYRIQEQVAVFANNPDVILVAGDFDIIDEESDFLYREILPPNDEDIKRALLIRNPIAHGSVMLRKSAVIEAGSYRDIYGPTEDLDLWIRLMDIGKFSATGSTIYRWRVNEVGITSTNNSRSLNESKQHFIRLWDSSRAIDGKLISRKEITKHSHAFVEKYPKRGSYYKQAYLKDLSRLSVKYIARGKPFKGVAQLFIIASTGRTGLKIVWNRGVSIVKGRFAS